jgi:hypothetical protein
MIDGRKEFTDGDWVQAKRELHGGHITNGNGDVEMEVAVSEQDMVGADSGHQVARMGMEDEDNVLEELIAEGMEEAVHEQMLEASRLEARKEVEEVEEA